MSKRTKLVVAALGLTTIIFARPAYRLASWFAAYPIQYLRVGRPAYSKARTAADSFMAQAADAPWDYSNGSFILDFDGTFDGRPTWVFRYHNPKTGQKSKRIYVPIPEYQVYETAIGLDQIPLHGSLPK